MRSLAHGRPKPALFHVLADVLFHRLFHFRLELLVCGRHVPHGQATKRYRERKREIVNARQRERYRGEQAKAPTYDGTRDACPRPASETRQRSKLATACIGRAGRACALAMASATRPPATAAAAMPRTRLRIVRPSP